MQYDSYGKMVNDYQVFNLETRLNTERQRGIFFTVVKGFPMILCLWIHDTYTFDDTHRTLQHESYCTHAIHVF